MLKDKITRVFEKVYDLSIGDIKTLLPDLKAEVDKVTKIGDLKVEITQMPAGGQETLLCRLVFDMPHKVPLTTQ